MALDMALDLSVVVPLYNEEESVRPLYGAIIAGVAPLGVSFEIVFVDDGSQIGRASCRGRE